MKKVGKVREAHGLKGDLYILIPSGEISWLPQMKHFYLSPKDKPEQAQKYNTQRTKPFKKGFIVKAEEISNRNESEFVEQMDFYVDEELLVSKPGETIFLEEILNFKLKNPDQISLGQVVGFSSNGAQDLLKIQTAKGIAEVPFVDAFLKKIDFKNQYLIMDLPEGLLDLDSIPSEK